MHTRESMIFCLNQYFIKVVPRDSTEEESTLVQVMAVCLTGHKALLKPMLTNTFVVIRPEWVKFRVLMFFHDNEKPDRWVVQERCNSIANAPELRLSCTNPSKWSPHFCWQLMPWDHSVSTQGWLVSRHQTLPWGHSITKTDLHSKHKG